MGKWGDGKPGKLRFAWEQGKQGSKNLYIKKCNNITVKTF